MSFFFDFYVLQHITLLIQKSPNDCPHNVFRNFNIDILDDSNHKKNKQKLIKIINKLK
jgi:hypothetical protein